MIWSEQTAKSLGKISVGCTGALGKIRKKFRSTDYETGYNANQTANSGTKNVSCVVEGHFFGAILVAAKLRSCDANVRSAKSTN
jgi:hypothetical protein